MTNHGPFPFLVNVGNRIDQIVFHMKENVAFECVDKLSCTARGSGGFGSTGGYFFLVQTKRIWHFNILIIAQKFSLSVLNWLKMFNQ